MYGRRESPAGNGQRERESGPRSPGATWATEVHFPCAQGSSGSEARTQASPGVGWRAQTLGQPLFLLRRKRRPPIPESLEALGAVLASPAPGRPPSGWARPPTREQTLPPRPGPSTQRQARAAAATLLSAPEWLRSRNKGSEQRKSRNFFSPHRERQTKSQALSLHSHPSKSVTPNRSHGAFPESAPGRKIPDAPQLARLFRNLIPPNRIAKIGLRICNILED